MVTFAVSDVAPSLRPLQAIAIERALAMRVADPIDPESYRSARDRREPELGPVLEACGVNQPQLVQATPEATHPLIEAVHAAFAEHYPLTLAPDDVWLCVAQAFALHVEAHADALRDRFVRSEAKPRLQIERHNFLRGAPDNDWQGCFAEWSDAIATHIGKQRDLVVASFSTTGPIERAASELVLMSAMKSYFDFSLMTLCGIPAITLLGTVDDWRAIRRRAEVLAEYQLSGWVQLLLPVLDQFVAAASGRVDRGFWRSIYKCSDQSGGPYVTGWINVLFPYLDEGAPFPGSGRHGPIARNAYMDTWQQDVAATVEVQGLGDIGDVDPFRGTTLGSFPRGLSQVPLTWHYLGAILSMTLSGGFVGVAQNPRTLALRPAIGWAVTAADRGASAPE